MSTMAEAWMGMSTIMASVMFIYTMIQQFIPHQVGDYLELCVKRMIAFTDPYIEITVEEFSSQYFSRSEAYASIEAYLSPKTTKIGRRLKAQIGNDTKKLVFTMNDYEEMIDEFQGAKIWWYLGKTVPRTQTISYYPNEKRYFTLQFHRRHREIIMGLYLNHIIKEGEAIIAKNRQRKLYSNNPSEGDWSEVLFDHPLTFDHLAMNPTKKKEIMADLITFSTGEDYYAKIGKPWKRGYLLYGPPGTGKSSMIAAMSNLLNYDIYDLELTAVKDNSELRRLLTQTSNRSIIVIEDIDCSLDLTGKRKKKKDEAKKDLAHEMAEKEGDKKDGKVTLSGILNFIDGLWSACGGERIIVFTTNHVEKLDPALIRRGRMDKHIEMSYCCFEGFKVLAKNYLDLHSHELFETIQPLIDVIQISPADVAENLMPKTINKDPATCLKILIQALEKAKAEGKLKPKEEEDTLELSTKNVEAKEDAFNLLTKKLKRLIQLSRKTKSS